MDLFLCARDNNVRAILRLSLRVTDVIRSDLAVVVDDGRGFLGALLHPVLVATAARRGGEHREVGAI